MKDKNLLNVAGIVAIVLGILSCLTIVGAIVGVPVIIGGAKFRELANQSDEEIAANKETILVWSIVFLFLCTVSGVLGLIYYVGLDNITLFNSSQTTDSKYVELERINKLYKDKVLTKEEFEKEKERILSK